MLIDPFARSLSELGMFALSKKKSESFPASLFSGGYVGAWLDINDLSLLYTTDTGSTHVAAVSDQIGRAVTKSGGTVNALQATASLRPILGQWPSGGRYHIYHDRVDDKLTLAGMPAGTYTIGTASFAGIQVYKNYYSSGIIDIPGVDFTELFIINRALTTNEHDALFAYLATKLPTIGSTDVIRIYCYSSSVNLSITESSSSGATWEIGDGQTATGTSCVKTITPPQSIILRATDKNKITAFSLNSRYLYGQIDLNHIINLANAYFHDNKFSGALDLSANINIVDVHFYDNKFSGVLDLSTNVNIVNADFHNNLFSGFTGSVSSTLANLKLNNNLLTSSAVNNCLAALVAAGRTSASGTCIVNLGGTGNAAPTGQGITDKATLISRGWTVTTN